MEGKNENSSSSSKTPDEQQSPQRAEGSTRRQPSPGVQEPRQSRSQGGPSSGGPLWGVGGMPPVNLHAIPVGGSAGHATGSIGGFVTEAASRKRMREVGQGTVARRGGGDQFPYACTVCGKGFLTDKSLFGHMRTHRGRAWKGALPPPVFSREEFADTGLLNPVGGDEEGQGEQEVDQQVVHVETPAVEGGARVGIQEGSNLNVLQPQDPEGRVQYRVPDLNQSPPEEGNGNDNTN